MTRRSILPGPRTAAAIVALALAAPALANHGPGTSGGGSSTLSGETLAAGRWSVTLRTDATSYERFTRAEAEAIALRQGSFDALDRSLVETLEAVYGITDDLQVGAQLGWYWGDDFVSAEEEGNVAQSATADPSGLTDLWLSAKWRFLRGEAGNVAVQAGLKLPTGDDDERLSNGEKLEASSQPGTGAFDVQAGLAYSRYLDPRWTLDASALYVLRTEHDDFRVGDRFDAGAAVAYRLTRDVKAYPNWSVSGELLGTWIGKDQDAGESNDASGGATVYVAPGARVRLSSAAAISLSVALPVAQDLNGEQPEVQAKGAFALGLSF
jgi:hypothetical protein